MKLPSQAKTLYGEAGKDGATVTGLDGDSPSPLDWNGMFNPGNIHLILNLDGYGVVLGGSIRLSVFPGMIAICRPSEGESVYASRLPGSGRHRCLVLSVTPAWVAGHFGPAASALHPLLRGEPDRSTTPLEQIGQTRSMTLAERDLCEAMMAPSVPRPLRPFWFRGKLLECFTVFGAAPSGQGADHTGRQDHIRRRIDDATLWLRDHFTEELDLKTLSRHVGCAPHYLSRLFRLHTGKTLSQKLRQIRIDHAADLLRNGSNVTEAAFEVGYNSLSHFTKAFIIEKGVLPSHYRNS